MRSAMLEMQSAAYRPGDVALLYGPNADGTLNSGAPDAFGAGTVMPFAVDYGAFEGPAFVGPAFGAKQYGGSGYERALSDPFGQTPARLQLIARPLEFGCYQHAVQVTNKRGGLSLIGTAAGVLVNSSPSKPVRTAIAVALGVVTLTVTDAD